MLERPNNVTYLAHSGTNVLPRLHPICVTSRHPTNVLETSTFFLIRTNTDFHIYSPCYSFMNSKLSCYFSAKTATFVQHPILAWTLGLNSNPPRRTYKILFRCGALVPCMDVQKTSGAIWAIAFGSWTIRIQDLLTDAKT
jgi:hypothetical protein